MPRAGGDDRLDLRGRGRKHDSIREVPGMMRLVVAVMIAHRPGRHDTIGEDSMQFVEEDRGDVMGILHSRSEEVSAETVRSGHPPILPRGLTLSAT
jgi:hypothetical protein